MSDQDERSSDYSDEDADDDEATMVEEEGFDESEDVDDELRQLNDDAELSIEELRRRYNFNEPAREAAEATDTGDQPSASSSTRVVSTTTTATRVVKSAIASAVKTSVITTEVVANDDLIEYFPDDDEDDDYVPKQAFFWKKEVRIGDSYQAQSPLPATRSKPAGAEYTPAVNAQSLWAPQRTSDEKEQLEYFELAVFKRRRELKRAANGGDAAPDEPPQAQRPPTSKAIADDEEALFALLKNKYDANRTLAELDTNEGALPTANGPRLTASSVEWRPMTVQEVDAFEEAFRKHGKNFHLIQQEEGLSRRSVGELVKFYYTWKKTERHDMFVQTNRALGIPDTNNKTIDPMELLADHHQLNDINGGTISYTSSTTVTLGAATTGPAPSQPQKWLAVQSTPPASQEKR